MLVFTSCTNNYIPKARILASSLKEHHPDWEFCLLLGEDPPSGFNLEEESFDRLLFFDQIGIPDYKSWLFRHRVVEICTAAKGPALHYFLEKEKHDKVLYLDPDIMVLNTLCQLSDMLDSFDILLTPHQLMPQKTHFDIVNNEICSLQHGIYNLGFVGVAGRGQGREFAEWWKERLLHYCYDDIPSGLFTDQRWCDLAPAFFSNLKIIRDPGYNAASWNLTDRVIRQNKSGIFTANDALLRFYHFTGFDSGAGRIMTSIFGSDMPAVTELWSVYEARLHSFGHDELKHLAWKYMTFEDGTAITDDMRLLYRARMDLQRAFPDPFIIRDDGCFWRWYQNEQVQWPILRKIRRVYGLTRQYIKQNGATSLPSLCLKVCRALLTGGIPKLKEGIYAYQCSSAQTAGQLKSDSADILGISPACEGGSAMESVTELLSSLGCAQALTLVLTLPWGGGAADYLNSKLGDISNNKPLLVLAWDSSENNISACLHYKGQQTTFRFADLEDVSSSKIEFDEIWLNDLVGWSVSAPSGRELSFLQGIPVLLGKIIRLAKEHDTLVRFFFHEHFSVCPHWSLLNKNLKYCGVEQDDDVCKVCLAFWLQENVADFSVRAWRESWQALFNIAGEVNFFSQATLDIAKKVFFFPQNAKVVPHEPLITWNDIYVIPQNVPMAVAVVGSLYGPQKGSEMLADVAELLNEDERLVVIGTVEKQLPKNVVVTGKYSREELPALLRKYSITVGLMPSICPETFSYVTQECMSLGLPMVAFPLGAQGERIGGWEHGLLADDVSPKKAVEALRELHSRYQRSGEVNV